MRACSFCLHKHYDGEGTKREARAEKTTLREQAKITEARATGSTSLPTLSSKLLGALTSDQLLSQSLRIAQIFAGGIFQRLVRLQMDALAGLSGGKSALVIRCSPSHCSRAGGWRLLPASGCRCTPAHGHGPARGTRLEAPGYDLGTAPWREWL